VLLVATALLTVFCDRKTLTTHQGHPVADNQSLRSVGERRPATLENYQFIEKSPTSVASALPSGSSMRAAPARTVGRIFRQNRRGAGVEVHPGQGSDTDGRARRWHQFLGRARTFSYSDTQRYRVGIVLQ
jgi:hypothetical protein